MAELDFMGQLHNSTPRDYLARVNDPDYPKPRAASLAKKWGFDYWDGDRRINYGGYKYIPGRWSGVASSLIEHYNLTDGCRVLDVGCGKGFLIHELKLLNPNLEVFGLDISNYAITHAHATVVKYLCLGTAADLPFETDSFDLVISINTLHNLLNYDLAKALAEIDRVSLAGRAYLCVESYRNEIEKANLLYWQVTCETFFTPEDWLGFMKGCGSRGDHSFIYFQ